MMFPTPPSFRIGAVRAPFHTGEAAPHVGALSADRVCVVTASSAGADAPSVTAAPETRWEASFTELWWKLGAETKAAILDLLPPDWSFEGKRVLDFGSGPGRTLRQFLAEADRADFWGVDLEAANVEQLRSTLVPPVHAVQCGYDPPLELESASVDLAWAISVFTHLTDNSVPWLLELHRLLKPGGLLIATYMGRWVSEFVTGEPWDEDRVGMNMLHMSGLSDGGGPLVLISDWWLREHWARAFEVLEIAPQQHNQSWALLRKRDVALSVDDVLRPSDDPREYAALRHNLFQVQREIRFYQRAVEELERKHAHASDELRRGYEGSLSWQLTGPLRRAAGVIRSYRQRRTPR